MDISTAFISVEQLALIPIAMGLVSAAKVTGITGTENRYAPLISIVLGVALSFLLPSVTVPFTILAGLVIGLTGAGLYSGAKTTFAGSNAG